MGCKHCSFKSCCIKLWIPSITELQNGNKKGGKKYLFLPPGRPCNGFPAGRAAAGPSPMPSQPRRAARPGEPGTDLGPRTAPTSGDQGQGRGRGLPSPAPRPLAAQSPGIRCQSLRPGGGRRGCRSLSPSRTCSARPGPRPAPPGPEPGSVRRPTCPHSPLADMVQAAGAEAGRRRRNP